MAQSPRSSEVLIEALRTHSVEGYPIVIPLFGDAHIVRQGGTAPLRVYDMDTKRQTHGSPMPFYWVSIDHPMPYSKYAEAKRLSKDPLSPEQWGELQERSRGDRTPIPLVGDEAQKRIDAGESVSRYEAEYEALYDGGQLDGDGRVAFTSVFPEQVHMPADKLKKGMLLEYKNDKGAFFMGRCLGHAKGKKIVLLELFSPVPFTQMKGSVEKDDLPEIKKGFYSEYTYSISYGLMHGWEDAADKAPEVIEKLGELPPGDLSEDEREYLLKDALPISMIEELCRQMYPDFAQEFPNAAPCVWHSFIMYILPISVGARNGTFKPLPENVVGEEFVITIEDE